MKITIIEHKELKKAVSARELYKFLETNKSFPELFVKNIENGYWYEDKDYIILTNKNNVDQTELVDNTDYLITPILSIKILLKLRTKRAFKAINFFSILIEQEEILEKIQSIRKQLESLTNRILYTDKALYRYFDYV